MCNAAINVLPDGVEGVRSMIGGIKLWDDLGYPVEGTVEVDAEDVADEDAEEVDD